MTSAALTLLMIVTATGQVTYTYSIPAEYRPIATGNLQQQELDEHKAAFEQLWDKELVTRFDDLPLSGKVPEYRTPYPGHDYPDRTGGTLAAMAKYDYAFHGGHSKAYQFEREDLAFHTTVRKPGHEIVRRGMFGRIIDISHAPSVVPTWYGHCNGWTAAAIRHAEPTKSVVRNGVTFTPSDIKGLLAELYMYSRTQFLGGVDDAINPAMLHLALANWIGNQQHPIAMETAVGDPVINFPISAYRCSARRLSPNQLDVRTIITYTVHLPREYDRAPQSIRELYFHYTLTLGRDGEIVGGTYFGDSGKIDMVWIPLKPTQGGAEGNESGNPHLDIDEVLAIYRESVDEAVHEKWVNVDPTDAERALAQSNLPPKPAAENEDKPAEMDPAAAPATAEAAATPAPATIDTANSNAAVAPGAGQAGSPPVAATPEAPVATSAAPTTSAPTTSAPPPAPVAIPQ
jgi:hypothetical protein